MCKENAKNSEENCSRVTVTVDVAKIVRCLCITGVLIVAIIFGSKYLNNLLKIEEKD